MEYTKGEWIAKKLLPDRHGIIKQEAWEIVTPEYDVVAQHPHFAPIRKESDANPIAAAPDMYEALKAVLPWAKEWIKYLRNNVGLGQGAGADEILLSADKALAKAEGGK